MAVHYLRCTEYSVLRLRTDDHFMPGDLPADMGTSTYPPQTPDNGNGRLGLIACTAKVPLCERQPFRYGRRATLPSANGCQWLQRRY